MLTNKYMNANFFLWGFTTTSRTSHIYDYANRCNRGADDIHYNVISSDFPNVIEFYTTQPIKIDNLTSISNPPLGDHNVVDISADKEYWILSDGASDFTLIGSINNTLGTVFTATGPGTGFGTATEDLDITALVNTVEYTILTAGDSDFTLIGAADNIVGTTFTATGPGTGTGTVTEEHLITELVNLTEYTIVSDGATDFTLVGAADSNAGTVFTATGSGTGPGTVTDLAHGSRKLIEFNIVCNVTTMYRGRQTMPKFYMYSNDDNKSPIENGTCEWFILRKNDQVICMGEVSDSSGTGNIKLSSNVMSTTDIYRFYSLQFEMDGTRQVTTDPNTVLVSV